MFFNSFQMLHLLHNDISVLTYDFQHIFKELTNTIQLATCWKWCERTEKLLWCQYNISQLLENISQAMKNIVDIEY